jgi:hypothetical protein
LIATIEIERHRKSNPPLPEWLSRAYKEALQDLLELGLSDLRCVKDRETIRSILGVIALVKGDIKLGALISRSDDSQIAGALEEYYGWSELYSERSLP